MNRLSRIFSNRLSTLSSVSNTCLTVGNKAFFYRVNLPIRTFSNSTDKNIPETKLSLLQKTKEVAKHYWHGSKLLAYETRVSSKLLMKLLRGEKLIRREHRQLVRTSTDLFRLVPFVILMLIPFLELLLPVILKFFPNLLPSTFEDRFTKEEKVKRQLKVKMEMAKFMKEMADSISAEDKQWIGLKDLLEKARLANAPLSTEEIVKICQKLGGDVTLENLERPQLVNMCRYMGISALGTDQFLRNQLKKTIRTLRKDDKMIYSEGIHSLTYDELCSACHARGIKTIGVSEAYMRGELKNWVELQIEHNVPAPILILSRAFVLSEADRMEDALRATVSSLPENVIEEAAEDEESQAEGVTSAEKLESLKKQQELIETELTEEKEKKRTEKVQEKEGLTSEQAESLSEALSTLTSADPGSEEKADLEELLEESAKSTNEKNKKLAAKISKLIAEIGGELENYKKEIHQRLDKIDEDKDGSISTGELIGIMKSIRNSPKDAEKIAKIIKKFDADGDGKVFIEDIQKFNTQERDSK